MMCLQTIEVIPGSTHMLCLSKNGKNPKKKRNFEKKFGTFFGGPCNDIVLDEGIPGSTHIFYLEKNENKLKKKVEKGFGFFGGVTMIKYLIRESQRVATCYVFEKKNIFYSRFFLGLTIIKYFMGEYQRVPICFIFKK